MRGWDSKLELSAGTPQSRKTVYLENKKMDVQLVVP